MNRDEKIPKTQLRVAYAEILDGCSKFTSNKYGLIYAKHLKIWDTKDLDERREEHFQEAKEKGLPTNKEKVELLKKDGLWGDKQEDKVKELNTFILRMNETKNKLILKSEVKRLSGQIDKSQKELDKINNERTALVGLTSEIFADKKANDYYVYLTLCKDPEKKVAFFSPEEFDELSDIELSGLISNYNVISRRFSETNMKRVAVSAFFLNNFHLCKDNPFTFFGKPVVDLTYHQADLFSYGRYFKHVLSELKHQPPQEVMEDPDKLLEQYNIQQNKEKLDGNKDTTGTASTIVGASKDDLDALGMSPDEEGANVVDLNEAMKKADGNLTMEDMIKLHGM